VDVAFPYRIDGRGRTAGADHDRHVRDLVEQVLFTAPGERVNRPTFGSGVLALLFEPLDEARAAAAESTIQAALQRWLGDVILLEGVDVESDDSRLEITVTYVVRRTQERRVERLTRGGTGA
jgi:phage baseplate assembly protein W